MNRIWLVAGNQGFYHYTGQHGPVWCPKYANAHVFRSWDEAYKISNTGGKGY